MKNKKVTQESIAKDIMAVLRKVESFLPRGFFSLEEIMKIAIQILEDYISYVQRDAASKNSLYYVYYSFSSMQAVFYYRVANAIIHKNPQNDMDLFVAAKILSEIGKSYSKADIAPAASIGKRFCIDHSCGIVIGETCQIGNDCYILQNVTLGANGVINNPSGKRHPILGNDVVIAGNTSIYGNINIGSNTNIGPYVNIRCDIPENSIVYIKNGHPHVKNKITKEKVENISFKDISFNFLDSKDTP